MSGTLLAVSVAIVRGSSVIIIDSRAYGFWNSTLNKMHTRLHMVHSYETRGGLGRYVVIARASIHINLEYADASRSDD